MGERYQVTVRESGMGFRKDRVRDFSDGPVVKNLPCRAGDMGSVLGQGTKIPHASAAKPLCSQLLSPHALEPMRPNGRVCALQQTSSHDAVKTLLSRN